MSIMRSTRAQLEPPKIRHERKKRGANVSLNVSIGGNTRVGGQVSMRSRSQKGALKERGEEGTEGKRESVKSSLSTLTHS